MSPALGHVLAELGMATGDLSALSPVQSLHRTPLHWGCWFMHELKFPGSRRPPFSSPPSFYRVPQPPRAITVFKSPSPSFMTAAGTSKIRHLSGDQNQALAGTDFKQLSLQWARGRWEGTAGSCQGGGTSHPGYGARGKGAASSLWVLRAQGLATGSHESESPLARSPAVLARFLPFNKVINYCCWQG